MASTLGERLRALRRQRGLSQTELGTGLVSPSYLSLIETNKRAPESELLLHLARRLGTSPLYLLAGISLVEVISQRVQLQLAELALASGEIEQAHTTFAEIARREMLDREIANRAVWGVARTEEARGNLGAALTHMDALLEAVRAGEPGVSSPDLLTARCCLFSRTGDTARSIATGEQALKQLADLGLEPEPALAAGLIGAYQARGDHLAAARLADRVLAHAEEAASARGRISAYRNAAQAALAQDDYAVAFELASRAAAVLAGAERERTLAGVKIARAWLLIHTDNADLDGADALLSSAHDMLAGHGDGAGLGDCETTMAWSALARGEAGTAVRLANEAISRFDDCTTAGVQYAHVIRGLALVSAGQAVRGTVEVEAAASRLTEIGALADAAGAWRELGELLLKNGLTEPAIAALRHASPDGFVSRAKIAPATSPTR